MLLSSSTARCRQPPAAAGRLYGPRAGPATTTRRHRLVSQPHNTRAAAVDLVTQQQQEQERRAGDTNGATGSQRPGHTTGAAQTHPDGAPAPELFDWFKAWHPLVAVSSLKRDAPNAQKLLNMSLVVWWDKTDGGTWRCFEDLCPHRLAPLSEGRIHETGQLQCTYHGWQFDGAGACTAIPQLGDPKALATACSSSRSCVKAFPVYESHGLLWVYGSAGDSSAGEQPPAHLLMPAGDTLKAPWFQRDIPVGFDILLENFADPSHVPQSHHGVVGDRNAPQTLEMTTDEAASRDGGFAVQVHNPGRLGFGSYKMEFRPPCLVRHNFPGGATMLLYGIPTAPGHSRVIMSFVGHPDSHATRPPTPQLPAWLNVMLNAIDRVPALQHALNRNAIIDGDSYFLHVAERVLYARGDSTSWSKQYFMPGTSDAAVLALRRWLDTHGAALPTLPRSAADIPSLPREQVLDRLTQHTQHCPHCSAVLSAATFAAGVMAAVAAVAAGSIVAAVVAGSAKLLSPFCAGAAVVAAAAACAAAALWRFRSLFIFTDWVHAEH